MRTVRADLSHSYHVHKTYIESLQDQGRKVPKTELLYDSWTSKLTNDRYIYLLLWHGKQVVGMVWGHELREEPLKTIMIEGRFLRRAYRGKKRFARALLSSVKELSGGYDTVRMILPAKRVKLAGKYVPVGTVVELRGDSING